MQLKARRAVAAPIRPFMAWRDRETKLCLLEATAKIDALKASPEDKAKFLASVHKSLHPSRKHWVYGWEDLQKKKLKRAGKLTGN